MSKKEFLQWIYDRLVNVHNENELYDYMHKFKEIINTRAVPDVPELETVGHLWEYAEYYRDDRGWYGYVKVITEENPAHHVSPIAKVRHHDELVTRQNAAAMLAAKDKEIQELKEKLGVVSTERHADAEYIGHLQAELTQIKAQEPVDQMAEIERLKEVLRKAHASFENDRTGKSNDIQDEINKVLSGKDSK